MSTTQFRQPPTFTEQIAEGVKGNNSKWFRYFQQNELGTPPSNEIPVTLGGSPFSYTALMKGFVILSGGTVTNVSFSRTQGVFYTTGQTTGTFQMAQNDVLKVTYSAAPSMVFIPT